MRLSVALSWDLSLGLDDLERYLEITEEYLQKAKTDFETWFNEKSKGFTQEERDVFGENHTDTYWEYTEMFPRILHNSFFVSIYSCFEYEMSLICKWLKEERQLTQSMSELKGSTLDQFKKYCNRHAGLNIPFNDQLWEKIKYYSYIRHCIVHNKGIISGSRYEDKLCNEDKHKNIISRDAFGKEIAEIAITGQFCKEVISSMEEFLKVVVKAHDSQKQE